MGYLVCRKWETWQSYRSDRGQPPWIKVWRRLQQDHEWLALGDAKQGQLLKLWLLAADRNGRIPDDPDVLKLLCRFTEPFDLSDFLATDERSGWFEPAEPKEKDRRQAGARKGGNSRRAARQGGAARAPQFRGGQRRAEEVREEEKSSIEESSSLTGGGGSEPPLGAPALEGRAPRARPGGNGKIEPEPDAGAAHPEAAPSPGSQAAEKREAKLKGYRAQLDGLGVAWREAESVEQLSAKLAAALVAR